MSLEAPAAPRRTAAFSHEAFLYKGTDQFTDAMASFLGEGIAAGEPALAVIDRSKIKALRRALGRDAEAVTFEDTRAVGGNPARIIPVWQAFVDRFDHGRRMRGIGEPVWPGRTAAELLECHQHEVLLNLAFERVPMRLVCPYDAEGLAGSVLDEAMCTHPFLLSGDRADDSPGYRSTKPRHALEGSLPEPEGPVLTFAIGTTLLAEMRRFVSDHATANGLRPSRTVDVTLAVNELATNSLVHGFGVPTLRCWTNGPTLVYEVSDYGSIAEPLVGRRIPSTSAKDGRGLWLVNHLCDLVQLRSSATGTIVRVHMRRDGIPG